MSPYIRNQRVCGCLVSYSSSKMAGFTLKHLIPSLHDELRNRLEVLRFCDFSQHGSLPVFIKVKLTTKNT